MKLIAALVFVAATAATAAAQTDSAETLADQDCKRARAANKACTLSFEGETVDGNVISPDGIMSAVRGKTTFASLVRVRWDFRAEIIRAAENL